MAFDDFAFPLWLQAYLKNCFRVRTAKDWAANVISSFGDLIELAPAIPGSLAMADPPPTITLSPTSPPVIGSISVVRALMVLALPPVKAAVAAVATE